MSVNRPDYGEQEEQPLSTSAEGKRGGLTWVEKSGSPANKRKRFKTRRAHGGRGSAPR